MRHVDFSPLYRSTVGGVVEASGRDKDIQPLEDWAHPFGIANQESPNGPRANYRTAGEDEEALERRAVRLIAIADGRRNQPRQPAHAVRALAGHAGIPHHHGGPAL